ncbi:ketosteroid isomerase-like protein [Catalinimonas alkaloidigena]|uniref:YybH family protein n=1 Tax=Catalinimonas alkaloidigena TaxID=1075417 RepID=UPI0024062491|nr:nuclear transport factor 2 family protein [Catalinimonas alkaloidigena]MDF9796391.1 ketosteroid isomerase-like protein [Catalinimonas alkaloidigena]
MKTQLTFTLMIIFSILLAGCEEEKENSKVGETKTDIIGNEFPESKEAIHKIMDSIAQSIKDGDIDKLISFHAYSPKFTEFKNGEPRNGGDENEEFERNVFGSVTEILKFDMSDMKVAVYGDVANVTLHSDFHLKFGEDLAVVNDQISLLFVNTTNGWKIVHEHHSPLKKEN